MSEVLRGPQTREELKSWLNYELASYPVGKIAFLKEWLEIGEAAVLAKHQKLLRTSEYHANAHHRIRGAFSRMRLRRVQAKHAITIPLNRCGKGLKLMHVGPILVNGRALIGENCALHINTAIVASGTSDEAPVLGDGIVVGVGAVVLGGVTIANGVAVGANAVVTKDVLEPDIAVAGVPARKVSDNGRKKWAAGRRGDESR